MPLLPLLCYMNVHKNDEILSMHGKGSLPPMTLNPKPEVLRLLNSPPEIDSPNPSCGLSRNRYQAAGVPIYLRARRRGGRCHVSNNNKTKVICADLLNLVCD